MKINNIFIIDDDHLFSMTLEKKITALGDFTIHKFTNTENALQLLELYKPEIIFLDHILDGNLGVDSIPEIKKLVPKSEIIIVSNQRKVDVLRQALENGATDYFQKDVLLIHKSTDFVADLISRKSGFEKFWSKLFEH